MTLEPDVEALVKRRMRDHGLSFKRAVNEAIRDGLRQDRPSTEPFRTVTSDMGQPSVNLDKATQIAAELEDEEIIRKMRLGK